MREVSKQGSWGPGNTILVGNHTMFIKLSKEQGARISNGLKMLEFQAEEAWSIWKANNI